MNRGEPARRSAFRTGVGGPAVHRYLLTRLAAAEPLSDDEGSANRVSRYGCRGAVRPEHDTSGTAFQA